METIQKIISAYNFIIYDLADVRTKGLFFVDSPFPVLALLIGYVLFVLKIGPKFMKNRQPYNLKKVIIVYDAFQVVINAYIFFMAGHLGWFGKASFLCSEINQEDNAYTRNIAFHFHLYYMIKVLDLMDTVFFVLTKKFNHMTFLHVYHHASMVALSWGVTKYYPGGHHTFGGFINSFVHTIMYSYYLAAILYPQKIPIRLKKFITELQMYQFVVGSIVVGFPLVVPGCNYPKWILILLLPNTFMIFFLFYDFYRKTYYGKKKYVKNK